MTAGDVVETLPFYDFHCVELPFCRSLADHAIQWVHLTAEASVKGVRVLLLSAKGKLPFKFKVVADADFKKGELV